MFKHVSFFALLLLAAGCARDDSSSAATGPDGSPFPAARSVNAGRLASPAGVWAQPTVGAGHAFASLPDRGNLVGYPARPVVRRDGAYTWHRAELSEQHAIRAIATGIMRIKAPSGQELEFRYDRHEEYPNGDWSWVGHLIDGSQADDVVITFGAKAAFGTIAQPAGKAPLRLTIQNGVSWLVETDRAGIAAIHNSATDPKRPDYLVPPKTAASAQTAASDAASGVTASGAPATAAATTARDTVVDLVLGYTPGFVAGLGGDSQAQTRLKNMVAITNEAYVNSQVPGRVRLVKTVLVNYPDATLNDTALEELTGFKAPSTRTTPAAAFSALRAARDQYGADLVSLVRKFNDPENDGCGIAWLNGGSSTGHGSIDRSDEFFGYSVVSDGRDTGTDGKTYFCREETLAHELSHNMGSQHDRATATENGKVSYGVYPYSFGYKADSASGNFYTIMAYGDRGQTAYSTFSNPRSRLCGASPCGIENQADVARSLTQTMPLVAAFRETAVAFGKPVENDVNGDGRSDVLWRNYSSELLLSWSMNGAQFISSGASTMVNSYYVATTGDFNGDGRADLIWKNDQARVLYVWFSGVSGYTQQYIRSFPPDWDIVGAGDIDGDGKSDLLWRNSRTEQFSYWIMNGAQLVRSAAFPFVNTYFVAASGDFNGDGKLDVLWVRPGYNMYMWIGDGVGFQLQYVGPHGIGWEVVGAADVNADGKADILLRDSANERFSYMIMDGSNVIREAQSYMVNTYHVASVGDFNGDGLADIVWVRPGYNVYLWQGNGSGFDMQYVAWLAPGWAVAPGSRK